MFIDEEVDFIKSQIAHHERSIEHFLKISDHQKVNRHSGILRRFKEILPKMVEIQGHGSHHLNSSPPADSKKVGSRFGDLNELPDELRTQLLSVQYDPLEQKIVDIIKGEYDGIASIDEILVGMFRVYNEIEQRESIANKIYRMTRKELITSVPGRKGIYTIPGFDYIEASADEDDENLAKE